ncbi:hypothetical protein RhiirA4_457796 [Rhizophagus irregularis]|uniref:Uncharacterized protein n=1 Tax=Rhizophagus irregularis TaxID=588596 RepID=A0A2I1GAR9_9GLOM|nr:hypothetical protein RhiirA4_457796 [Rhizophagus irregularis]
MAESKLTFINLIKGIIPYELVTWSFWIDRCSKQKEKEKRLKINLKKVKENYNEEEYIDLNRKVNTFNLFNGLESLRSNIYFGMNMQVEF